MAGVYIHIPFCRKACTYCDFHFSTTRRQQGALVSALVREVGLRADFFPQTAPLDSLYLGGGTPSVLAAAEVSALVEAVKAHFPLRPGAEVTLEANPDDLHPAYLEALRAAGITRLSVGIQSFRPEDLTALNRSHTAAQALGCLPAARAAGFRDFSLDLILGLPGLDLAAWQANLDQALALAPPHLSVYALTVEARTALAHQVARGQVRIPPDEVYEAQYLAAHDRLTAAGYRHYELSNYARPGHEARHNSSYWAGQPYLGLGPSAHSYDGRRRSWNIAHNAHYLRALAAGQLATAETETLSARDRYHEYVMTGLRQAAGLDLARLQRWVPDWEARYGRVRDRYLAQGDLVARPGGIAASPAGWLRADAIIRDFFLD